MSEESKEPVVLDGENIPEKFRGKSVEDVLKAYSEAEKLISSKGEEVGGIKKELELLRKEKEEWNKKDPEPDPEPEGDEYEYVTRKDLSELTKTLKEMNTSFEEKLNKTKEETASQTTWELEKRQFLTKHPELESDDAETLALFGLRAGTNSLEESLQAYKKLGNKLGLSEIGEEKKTASDVDTGAAPEKEKDGPEPFSKEWMDRAKKGYKSVSSTL